MNQPPFPISPTTKKILGNFSQIAGQVLLEEGQTQTVKGGPAG